MRMDMFSLQGRVALVTGGSRGIGRMIAEGFLVAGCARVYISARHAAPCAAAADELSRQAGGQCLSIPMDVSTVEGCRALAAEIGEREGGRLDILVNNAGAAWLAPFDDFPENGWDKVMDLNVKSPFFLTQAMHGALKAAGTFERPAKVINIASVDALRPNTRETYSYHASKAGLVHLTRRMAARLIQDNIAVTAICPGAFASEMNTLARDHGEEVARQIPYARLGRPEDMAGAAIFLAAQTGDYVIGSTLTVDGGIVSVANGT